MSVLDNSHYISQYDPQDALGFAVRQPDQLTHDFAIADHSLGQPIKAVVFAGMGGSALVAEFMRTWPELRVPLVVSKNYTLPKFVDEHTLVICASFSGNTEETLSALQEAERRGALIASTAHGGQLAEEMKSSSHLFAQLPAAPQPRMAVFSMYRAVVEILVAAGLVESSRVEELAGLRDALRAEAEQWGPNVLTSQNLAKQIAEHIAGKTPIIYAGPLMYPAAFKWKIDANENAKNTAWCNEFSEIDHNELIGWSSHPIEKPFAPINLISSFEHPRILKRFMVTDKVLSGFRPEAVDVEAVGQSPLEHLLYLVLLGDFTTLYLAILNGVNPTPVDLVERFKLELNQ